MGLGLGMVLLFYAYDLVSRVDPKLEKFSVISPFAYANASRILGTGEIAAKGVLLGAGVLVLALGTAYVKYTGKDQM